MKNLIMTDEHAMISQAIVTSMKKSDRVALSKAGFTTAYFFGDENFLCDYLYCGLKKASLKIPMFSSVRYVSSGNDCAYRKKTLDTHEDTPMTLTEFNSAATVGNAIFFSLDCIDGLSEKERILSDLKAVFEFMRKNRESRCIISVMLPKIEWYPKDKATALSERELDYYFEKISEKTPEIEYLLEFEAICREYVREYMLDVSVLRFDNVFAPDRFHTPSIDLLGVVKETYSNKKAIIVNDDCKYITSICYIRDACNINFRALTKVLKGHEYNVALNAMSKETLKELIYRAFKNEIAISKDVMMGIEPLYNKMSSLKIRKRKLNSVCDLVSAVKHVVSFETGAEYDTSDNVAFYNGKIEEIQKLEVKILLEIDKICRENDIKYFLAGGTLLGAVRSGKAIPWDDDLDIGMLRGDYEKFRKICEKSLPESFTYSSPFNGSNSHYTIDKVRLKDTYFSTNYSSANVVQDGVFVDILVYDQTSNIAFFQKLQTFLLGVIYDCLIVRWYNKPRRNFHYRLTKLLLPFLRLVPYRVYHGLFESIVKWYKNKKDAKWLIDSVGKKLKDGPLPKAGLEDTVYVDFEDIKAPIPVDYTGYLNYAYGPDYMNMPNLSSRACPHNFARIDLGKYIFDVDETTPFREVDLRGELFEEEIDDFGIDAEKFSHIRRSRDELDLNYDNGDSDGPFDAGVTEESLPDDDGILEDVSND